MELTKEQSLLVRVLYTMKISEEFTIVIAMKLENSEKIKQFLAWIIPYQKMEMTEELQHKIFNKAMQISKLEAKKK